MDKEDDITSSQWISRVYRKLYDLPKVNFQQEVMPGEKATLLPACFCDFFVTLGLRISGDTVWMSSAWSCSLFSRSQGLILSNRLCSPVFLMTVLPEGKDYPDIPFQNESSSLPHTLENILR